MKITGFNPQIITPDPEPTIELFEALGFHRTHNKTGDDDVVFSSYRMENENDFHVDVMVVEGVSKTYTAIRINVDDFDAAMELFLSKGYREARNHPPRYTNSSKYIYLVNPTKTLICISYHIKKA